MSLASMQTTCAACGGRFNDGEFDFETLVDSVVRSIAVHSGCSTYPLTANQSAGKVASIRSLAERVPKEGTGNA